MEVIGAGLGRTGTSSIQKALEILGLGPCYHMNENFAHNHGDLWNTVEEAKTISAREAALRAIFDEKGYKSSADYPTCSFFEDLLRMNPKAKVVLSVRDKPEDWYKSVHSTIFVRQTGGDVPLHQKIFPFGLHEWVLKPIPWLPDANSDKLGKIIVRMFLGKPHDFSKKGLEHAYTEWNQHVIDKVPISQLLVFNVKQGWEPLCKFLKKPIPNEPFPNTNKKEDVDVESITKEVITLGSVAVFYGGIATLGFLAYKYDLKRAISRYF